MEAPLITFKAGRCEFDADVSSSVKPDPTPGYVYLRQEEGMCEFCWRPRTAPHTEPTEDLWIPPQDATFKPYRPSNAKSAIAGRIYVLKFSSSTARHFFWLQSTPSKASDHSEFSPRDKKIGEIVNAILQGEEVDVRTELRNVPQNGNGSEDSGDDDDDTAMEDVDGPGSGGSLRRAASGGAGAGATGGDVREEGEEAREGGADGGRAASTLSSTDPTQTAVQNFLRSLQGSNLTSPNPQQQRIEDPFTTLPDLLPPTTTLPTLSSLSTTQLDTLLTHLPPSLTLLHAGLPASEISTLESSASAGDTDAQETISAISLSLEDDTKQQILEKVLRSPQFVQACASLTHAIRDGGLPMIAEVLGVKVRNGGLLNAASGVPIGGGDAVRAFVDGMREGVREDEEGDEKMEEE